MILLSLHPLSLMHKNPQRHKIIHCMRPVGRKDQSEHVYYFVELNLCWALKLKDYILIFPVHCNTEFWSLSSD